MSAHSTLAERAGNPNRLGSFHDGNFYKFRRLERLDADAARQHFDHGVAARLARLQVLLGAEWRDAIDDAEIAALGKRLASARRDEGRTVESSDARIMTLVASFV